MSEFLRAPDKGTQHIGFEMSTTILISVIPNSRTVFPTRLPGPRGSTHREGSIVGRRGRGGVSYLAFSNSYE